MYFEFPVLPLRMLCEQFAHHRRVVAVFKVRREVTSKVNVDEVSDANTTRRNKQQNQQGKRNRN